MTLRSIDKKKKILFYIILFLLFSTQITKGKNEKNHSTVKLNNIIVSGLSDDNNYGVYQSLKFLLKKNIFFVDKSNFSNILKENELVENYNVKKIYPNLIKVKIKKTDLLAVTSYNNKKFYIGANGKLISFDKIKEFSVSLPFVYSKSNYIDFIKLKKIIDQSDFQFQQIESFYYFPNNRWDYKTTKGVLVKLPKKEILKSLKTVYLIESNEKFKKSKTIDLRLPNNIIISDE